MGCAVGGLIIGILAALFFLRRRSKSNPGPEMVDAHAGRKSFESRALTASPVEPSLNASDLDQFLLIPRSDRGLAGELQSLGHLIEQHVEDTYHLFSVNQSVGSLSQALAELGLAVDGEALPGPAQLAGLSANPRTRHAALRHVISRVIFDSLAARSTSKLSMLPLAMSSLVREMPPCERHLGNPEGRFYLAHRVNCSLSS